MRTPIRRSEASTKQPPRRARGQGLVEFALVVPIVLLIIFGIIDFGRAIYAYNTIDNSARTAGRVAIVSQTASSIQTAAINQAVALAIPATNVTISHDGCAISYSIGCIVSVTVTYAFHPITPVIGQIWKTINMSSTTHLPIEHVGP
jgi:Flp pilus assembly protein TadG